jgi:hypothetical protein
VKCFKCEQFGHYKSSCPLLSAVKEDRGARSHEHGDPSPKLSVEALRVSALLDTGARCNVLSTHIHDKMVTEGLIFEVEEIAQPLVRLLAPDGNTLSWCRTVKIAMRQAAEAPTAYLRCLIADVVDDLIIGIDDIRQQSLGEFLGVSTQRLPQQLCLRRRY